MILKDKCHWVPSLAMEKAIYPGSTITEQGAIVARLNNAGIESVSMATGLSATEEFLGIALPDNRPIATLSSAEEAMVPTTTPRTVTLKKSNLVSGQLSVFSAAGALLTLGADYTVAANVVAFSAATYAGTICLFVYRYNPTAQELAALYGSEYVNKSASHFHSTVTVVTGDAEIYFDCFDARRAYVINTSSLYTQATGLVSSTDAGSATNLTTGFGARVIHSPDADLPFLGWRYSA